MAPSVPLCPESVTREGVSPDKRKCMCVCVCVCVCVCLTCDALLSAHLFQTAMRRKGAVRGNGTNTWFWVMTGLERDFGSRRGQNGGEELSRWGWGRGSQCSENRQAHFGLEKGRT